MQSDIQAKALNMDWGAGWHVFFMILTLVSLSCFSYIIAKRLSPLRLGAPDPRFNDLSTRVRKVLRYWLVQWKQPRYRLAGILHIIIFVGFLVLAVRSLSLVILGVIGPNRLVLAPNAVADMYAIAKDYGSTLVFVAVAMAAIRHVIFRPSRYVTPARYGGGHRYEPLLVLGLIATLMLSESLFGATQEAIALKMAITRKVPPPLTLDWSWYQLLSSATLVSLRRLQFASYLIHELTFFSFLCFLPFGKHFHVVTSLFNVFFTKLDREALKPVRWGASDEDIANAPSLGVKTFADFTWKQMLDFYSCADCGRCSDQCPSNAVGRPLSPRFFSIKARDYAFRHYPVFGKSRNGAALVSNLYSEDEIWSCTTCGACEEECPLVVEYIDKIVDLRRGLVDQGKVPSTLQKPLKALESRGNPYGKLEKKRADWAKTEEMQKSCPVRIVNGQATSTLYFVDSTTSYDDRMQSIARATARILNHTGEDFAILGAAERDSGHEVRRLGEEILFFSLRDQNKEAIVASGAKRIVTNDPHAYNALKRDYDRLAPVEHISETMARAVEHGGIHFQRIENTDDVYTYHDPCYLGRHNQIYDQPRAVLDAIPGLKRTEMRRCRDRSFCCGGGGLMLFYEPKEDERMGVRRVRMAAEAGANVIVTACPFCLANIEDAIKVTGYEGKIKAIDLAEFADRQMTREPASAGAAK